MSCPCEPASFKPNVRIGARYGKASKHSGHSCPHPERLELPKMIHRQRLQRQLPDQSMGVLLKIEGNCSCLKAKVAHMVGHLPTSLPFWAAKLVTFSLPLNVPTVFPCLFVTVPLTGMLVNEAL